MAVLNLRFLKKDSKLTGLFWNLLWGFLFLSACQKQFTLENRNSPPNLDQSGGQTNVIQSDSNTTGIASTPNKANPITSSAASSAELPLNGNATTTSTSINIFTPFEMPFYDQNDPLLPQEWFPNGSKSTNLCAPTSASMIWQAVTQKLLNASPSRTPASSSWTKTQFIPFSGTSWRQVVNMATKMNTSPTDGTGFDQASTLSTFCSDYSYSNCSGEKSVWPTGVTTALLTTKAKQGNKATAIMLNLGYYKEIINIVAGQTIGTLKRSGGHSVVMNGYEETITKTTTAGQSQQSVTTRLKIQNPLGGFLVRYTIQPFTTNYRLNCPNSTNGICGSVASTSAIGIGYIPELFKDSNIYTLVEAYTAVTTSQ